MNVVVFSIRVIFTRWACCAFIGILWLERIVVRCPNIMIILVNDTSI
jgi:hypothetical protein